MPKRVDVAQKRRDILAAAAETFARRGPHGTNLARVAAAAGMGKSSLYHYFSTRQALCSALADDLLRHEADLFEAVVAAPGPAAQRLGALLDAIAALFDEWVSVGPLLVDFLRDRRGRRRVQQTFRRARAALAALIQDGQRTGVFRAGPPPALAAVALACLDGLLLQEVIEAGCTGGARTRALLRDMVMAALRPQGAE
jgi:AcrR family transcriptional regulator